MAPSLLSEPCSVWYARPPPGTHMLCPCGSAVIRVARRARNAAYWQVLYSCTGVFGYLQFGEHVDGDIFVEFGYSTTVSVAKVLMALHIAMAAPVLMFPARRCIGYVLHRRRGQSELPYTSSHCTSQLQHAALGKPLTAVGVGCKVQAGVVRPMATRLWQPWQRKAVACSSSLAYWQSSSPR